MEELKRKGIKNGYKRERKGNSGSGADLEG